MSAWIDDMPAARERGVLRFITAGSVDDGKSTLIGRLLYDSKGVFADQLDAVARARHRRVAAGQIDFALLTDGLEAEREQGITIDVAYRYFATPRRTFIVADAPGHEQYTRNMVTGASTAQAAVILVDATRVADGRLLAQTRRHTTLAHLLGIRHLVVAVNKMDLVGWDGAVFERISHAYADFAAGLGIQAYHRLPVSALGGDNIVRASPHMPWYEGPPLLPLLESLPLDEGRAHLALRLPVQWVLRDGGDRVDDLRGYAGQIASGALAVGDEVVVQPSGVSARVTQLLNGQRRVERAVAGDSVTVVLDRHVDVSRGDVLTDAGPVRVSRTWEADLCWLDSQPLHTARKYLLKQGTRLTTVRVQAVHTRRDPVTLQPSPVSDGSLAMNDIGEVSLVTREALVADDYAELPATGAFILIDTATHQTAGAGMLRAPAPAIRLVADAERT